MGFSVMLWGAEKVVPVNRPTGALTVLLWKFVFFIFKLGRFYSCFQGLLFTSDTIKWTHEHFFALKPMRKSRFFFFLFAFKLPLKPMCNFNLELYNTNYFSRKKYNHYPHFIVECMAYIPCKFRVWYASFLEKIVYTLCTKKN